MIEKNLGKYALYAVAVVLLFWSGMWLRTGFYPSQLPVIGLIGLAGVVALAIGKKVPTKRPEPRDNARTGQD